jgi:hypothetical protein
LDISSTIASHTTYFRSLHPLSALGNFREEFFRVYQSDEINDADEQPSPEISDVHLLNMELALPRDGEGPEVARVTKRLRDDNGNPVGRASNNSITDTRVFEVEYLDGYTTTMWANTITENMFAQVDHEGGRLLLLDEVIDHRSTKDATTQADAFINATNGRRRQKQTTRGWELLLKWKDGSEAWLLLKDAKEAFPVQLAEYSVQVRIFVTSCPNSCLLFGTKSSPLLNR